MFRVRFVRFVSCLSEVEICGNNIDNTKTFSSWPPSRQSRRPCASRFAYGAPVRDAVTQRRERARNPTHRRNIPCARGTSIERAPSQWARFIRKWRHHNFQLLCRWRPILSRLGCIRPDHVPDRHLARFQRPWLRHAPCAMQGEISSCALTARGCRLYAVAAGHQPHLPTPPLISPPRILHGPLCCP